MSPKKLCFTCHEKVMTGITESTVKHLPVQEGKCTECHSPHGTKLKYQLLNRTNELCLSCHERIVTTTVRKGHIEMEEGDCLSCHATHYSDIQSLLSGDDPAICIQCHSTDTERLLQMHRESFDKISQCTTCHEPHVTESPGLLREIKHEPFIRGDCEACHV